MIRRFLVITSIMFILCLNSRAQVCNTLYFMDRVPQSVLLNPAIQPKCDFFLGFADEINVGNSFRLNDLLYYDSRLDSLITFLHDSVSQNNFIQKLKSSNTLYSNVEVNAFNLGFRINDMYFTFSASTKAFIDASFPRDFIRLALKKIDSISSYDFSGLRANALAYNEFALGFSKNINDEFSVGIRAKLIDGLSDFTSTNKSFQLNFSVDNRLYRQDIHSDVNINIAAPGLKIYSHAGKIDSVKTADNPMDYYSPFKNFGMGVDLGVTYKGVDKFVFSASLLDLGFINWKNGVYNVKMVQDTTFEGVTINPFNKDSNFYSNLADSFKNTLKLSSVKSGYTTGLPTKLYLGIEYSPVPFLSLGVLSFSEYFKQKMYQQFVLSANLRFSRMAMLSTSYTILDNGFTNMGVGMTCRLPFPLYYIVPMNFYVIADNIPLYYSKQYIPYKAKTFNLRTGFNIVFGCGQQRKKRDKPLIFE